MELASKLFKGDYKIWIIFMILAAISIIEGYSAMSTLAYKEEFFWMPIWRHIMFLGAGMVAMVILAQIHYNKIGRFLLLGYPFAFLLLLLTPFLGMELNGAHRWMFGLQPSELGKLVVIVYLAYMLSRDKIAINQRFWLVLIGVSLICLLILPDNFSTAFLLFSVSYLMMFIGQMPWKKMLKLALTMFLLLMIFVVLLLTLPDKMIEDHGRLLTWKYRITEFVNFKHANTQEELKVQNLSLYDDNYQVTQAKIAIANGGILGKLPGHGLQRDFLPQAFSDFIYAIIIEELGMVGGIIVMLMYIFLLVRVGIIARKCKSDFPKFLVLGSGLLIVAQAMANMAVAVDLIPVTGQPMPLVSRGGTSIIVTCCYFGIILSVSRFGAGYGKEENLIQEVPLEGTEETIPEENLNQINSSQEKVEEVEFEELTQEVKNQE